MKTVVFKEGEEIDILFVRDSLLTNVKGTLKDVTDSSIRIKDQYYEIAYIKAFIDDRWFYPFFSELCWKASLGIIIIDPVNRALAHTYPVFRPEPFILAGGLTALGFSSKLFYKRKRWIGEKWRIVLLDYDY